MASEEEYKEIFQAEALENHEELNKLFTKLEQDPTNRRAIDAIFRITHTLKGNALGMGFKKIGQLAHAMEDIFGEIREGKLELSFDIFDDLYRAVDVLGALIDALKTGKKVKYQGIKTKLGVILRSVQEENGAPAPASAPAPAEQPTAESQPAQEEVPAAAQETPVETPSNETPAAEAQPEAAESATAEAPTSAPVAEAIPVDAEEVEDEEEDDGEDEDVSNNITFSDLVQVPVRKLDELMNLVGELTIERDRLISQFGQDNQADSRTDFSRLMRITSDLQYSVMDVRLVQVGFLFNKFHRVLRDAARIEDKKVQLKLEGTETEIDRNVLQIISDSMIHLVRNSVGHGIEKPEDRKKAGKSQTGTVTLSARNESDSVIIDIMDDGKGIDPEIIKKKAIKQGLTTPEIARKMTDDEIIQFIFEPGFSSMEQVTAISGRGVGMDVVKRCIDSIGGNVHVSSQIGLGSVISLHLPSSMAVKGSLLFLLKGQEYAIPLTYTEAVVSLYKEEIHKVSQGLMATYLDKTISIVFLKDLFEMQSMDALNDKSILHKSYDAISKDQQLHIVVVSYNGCDVGFVVDRLLQQKEIVEKPLMKPVDNVAYISGVTIMGNGNVCLVLNIAAIVNHIFKSVRTKQLA